MTYEQWDMVADAVVPLLGVAALSIPLLKTQQNRWAYYGSVVIAYALTLGLRSLNHSEYAIWPMLGVQYSGHTGVFCVAGMSIIAWKPKLAWVVGSIFVLYTWLMLYQQYHTIGDIALTAAVMAPATWIIHEALQRLARRQTMAAQ